MKYAITEEQFLIYHYGEKKALFILKNNLPDHYRTTYQKLQNGGNFGWNWAAFFFGSLWFIYQGMPLAFFAFFISMSIIFAIMPWILIMSGLALFYSILGLFGSLTLFGILAGFFGDQFLINRLSEKLKNGYFGDLHPDTQSKFIEKMGVTEEQYLTFIYGEEKAQSLIKYNIPNHYRGTFKKFALGQEYVWNWSACFAAYWFLYRRMPHMAILFAFQGFLISLIASLFLSDAILESPLHTDLEKIIILFFIIFGLLGNRLLFKYVSKQIQKNNFQALDKGGALKWVLADILVTEILIIIFKSIAYIGSKDPSQWHTLLITIAGLIVPGVAMIDTQRQIQAYKKSITLE